MSRLSVLKCLGGGKRDHYECANINDLAKHTGLPMMDDEQTVSDFALLAQHSSRTHLKCMIESGVCNYSFDCL